MLNKVGLVWIEDLKESQKVTHFVKSSLYFLMDSLGSFTWDMIVWTNGGGVMMMHLERGVGQIKIRRQAGMTHWMMWMLYWAGPRQSLRMMYLRLAEFLIEMINWGETVKVK